MHKVRVLFAGREIPKSPYSVMVEGHAGDATKVTASGPGLLPDGVVVNKGTYFDIFTKDAGRGVPEVIILDPQVSVGVDEVFLISEIQYLDASERPCQIMQLDDDLFLFFFRFFLLLDLRRQRSSEAKV